MIGRKKQRIPSCEWRCEAWLMGLAFSIDGKHLFTSEPGTGERPIRIWNVASCSVVLEKPFANRLPLFNVTSDGLLVVASEKGDVVRLDAESLTEHSRFNVSQGNRRGTVTSGYWLDAAENRVITGSWDCRGRCWDAATGELLAEIDRKHNVDTVACLPNGQSLLTDYTGFVVWDTTENSITAHHEHTLGNYAVSPDASRLIALNDRRNLTCWDTDNWTHISFTVKAKKNGVCNYQFSQDGKILAIPCEAARVILLNLDDGKVLYQHTRKGLSLNGMAFSSDGSKLACVWRDGTESIMEVVDASSIPVIADRLDRDSKMPTERSAAAVSRRGRVSIARKDNRSTLAAKGIDAKISELEILIGHPLPTDYSNFVRTHGGSTPIPDGFRFLEGQSWVENSVQTFLSLSSAEDESISAAFVEVKNTIEDALGEDDLDDVLLPIAKDHNFNWICLVLGGERAGHVVFFDHEDGYEEHLCEKLIATTFTQFIDSLHVRSDV